MKLKIIHLSNSPENAALVNDELQNSYLHFELKRADTKESLISLLPHFNAAIVITDFSLHAFDPLEAFKMIEERNLAVPFILIGDEAHEKFRENIIKQDAFSYIPENALKSLPGAILSAVNNYPRSSHNGKYNYEMPADQIEKDPVLKRVADELTLATKTCKVGIWDWDILNNEFVWDRTTSKNYGLTLVPGKVTRDVAEESIHPDDIADVRNGLQRALTGAKDYELEFRIIWPDKTIHFVREVGMVERNNEGLAVRMIATNQDITNTKEMQSELIKYQTNSKKKKAEIILLAHERERESIGYELHDNVNQVLASAKMYIDLFRADTIEEKAIKAKTKEYIFIAMEEIRKLSKQLVVSHINNIGLIGSIEGFVSDTRNSQFFGIEFTCKDERIENLVSLKKISLFRILQEQMKNIVSYSHAKNVSIELQSLNNHVTLSIADDGVGFDPSKTRKGLGLSHIFERADLYNGNMEIITAPNEGCRLIVNIPFDSDL